MKILVLVYFWNVGDNILSYLVEVQGFILAVDPKNPQFYKAVGLFPGKSGEKPPGKIFRVKILDFGRSVNIVDGI